jgi:hypothetical protein
MLINQFLHTNRPIDLGPLIGDFDMALIQQRGKEHKQVGGSFAMILVIIALWLTILGRNGLEIFADQLNGRFFKANQGQAHIFWSLIFFQHIFQVVHKIGVLFWWNASLFSEPELQFVFLLHVTDGRMRYIWDVLQPDHFTG